jgi:hypothetical protein
LDFEKGSKWVCVPHGAIVARRPMYKHMPNHVVERTIDLDSWEDVKEILEAKTQNQTNTQLMDQSNVIQTPQKQELQIGKRTFSNTHYEMGIDDQLSEQLKKNLKGDEELYLEGC